MAAIWARSVSHCETSLKNDVEQCKGAVVCKVITRVYDYIYNALKKRSAMSPITIYIYIYFNDKSMFLWFTSSGFRKELVCLFVILLSRFVLLCGASVVVIFSSVDVKFEYTTPALLVLASSILKGAGLRPITS